MIFDKLETQRNSKGTQVLALIDPDVKNDNIFPQIIDTVNKSNFDGLLVGGSRIVDDNFNKRLLGITLLAASATTKKIAIVLNSVKSIFHIISIMHSRNSSSFTIHHHGLLAHHEHHHVCVNLQHALA